MNTIREIQRKQKGSALAMVLVCMLTLTILGMGLLSLSYGARYRATELENETSALLAAEAGYERAIFWMSQQPDLLYVLKTGDTLEQSYTINDSHGYVEIGFYSFYGSRPAYRVVSVAECGRHRKKIDAIMMQAISGWDMGQCRVPKGGSSTTEVYFADGEIIDMPVHINKADDSPDYRDIFINGSPTFLHQVSIGESRYTSSSVDKYSSVIDLFINGIEFDQPNSKVTDAEAIATKIERFKESTKGDYTFTPSANASLTLAQPAVQLEFFVQGDVGKVRITNDCTVRGFRRSSDGYTWDFKVRPGSDGKIYDRYPIYGYHVAPTNGGGNIEQVTKDITDTYVQQEIEGILSEEGGQIYVNGNVIIGGDSNLHNGDQMVKGKITVVATGNIWVADSIRLDGNHDNVGRPSSDNPNALGLIASGVVRVADPGMSEYSYVDNGVVEPADHKYAPIANYDGSGPNYSRILPEPLVIEAAVTVGGGGWGAENVMRTWSSGGRKNVNTQDRLVIYGTVTELIRGVVGLIGYDGFIKQYYFDERMLKGILPGDMWLQAKYLSTPNGWKGYRPDDDEVNF